VRRKYLTSHVAVESVYDNLDLVRGSPGGGTLYNGHNNNNHPKGVI
jgi:hypothetical protein